LLAIDVAMSNLGKSGRILSTAMTRQMLRPIKDDMGLGFVIRPGDKHGYFSHSGGNQGYRCHLVMYADNGKGIVVMTNSDAGQLLAALLVRSVARTYDWPSHERQSVSAGLADDIFAQLDQSESERKKIVIDENTLARYAGRYELSPGLVFEVTHVADHLEVRLGDQPRFPVYPESESTFFYEVVDAQITFTQDSAGETVSLVLHQGGRDQEAKRVQ